MPIYLQLNIDLYINTNLQSQTNFVIKINPNNIC